MIDFSISEGSCAILIGEIHEKQKGHWSALILNVYWFKIIICQKSYF